MQKNKDFFAALKSSVDIDERFDFRFEKIQHDVKKGEFLIHFESNLLPAETYLIIERYVREKINEKTRLFVSYRDIDKTGEEGIIAHIRQLCCSIKKPLAPFISRADMRFVNECLHIDFTDDFGKELFNSSGLIEYLEDYFKRCLKSETRVLPGKCAGAREPVKLSVLREHLIEKEKKSPKTEPAKAEPAAKRDKEEKEEKTSVIHGSNVKGDLTPIKDISEATGLCVIRGNVLTVDSFNIKNEVRGKKSIIVFSVTDNSSSITCKAFVARDKCDQIKERLKDAAVLVSGNAAYDSFSKEVCISVKNIEETEAIRRQDNAEIKRVELHLHTNMSALDAVADEGDVVRRAAEFGHSAIAITDHGVVQAFPGAFDASKKLGIKIIYGMEGYLINDISDDYSETFEDEYIVFDLETTGFSPYSCGITEIGAVRLRHGEAVDTFNTFVNPGCSISRQITETTGITDEMVKDAPPIPEALRMFKEYIGDDAYLAAHNSPFDMSFLEKHGKDSGIRFDNKCLDTIWLFKRALPGHKSYGLGRIAEDLGITFNHHRALDDALCTAKIMKICMDKAASANGNKGTVNEKELRNFHIILLCKDKKGLFNLYKLVSESHIHHFYRKPRIPRSLLIKHREGLIIGSACEQGELIQGILRYASDGELEHIASFYDYLEVQPDGNNAFMVREGRLRDIDGVRDITRKVIALGDRIGKKVVATCDAHFIEPQDEYFRRILMHGQGFTDADNQAPLYFRTTSEMLAEFTYLGAEKAKEIVITNTREIADKIENIVLLPDEPAMPEIPGAGEKLVEMDFKRAKEVYGDPLPKIVEDRLNFELDAINRHGYGVLYYIAYELVRHSMADGYLVGSRGSVGSSLAATMAGITEVNSLPPHYVCRKCKYSDFNIDKNIACGPDLPPKKCPKCGEELNRDGYEIPFAVFLGIDADKVPDIDLNFSGEYQPHAFQFLLDYFGTEYVFRAGTISSIKEQTAFGFVKAYVDEKGINASKAEIDRLAKGISGTKRTTGQHPGGMVILPKNRDIHEFTPIQYPANDESSGSVTTHYNFGSLHDRLIKLDILGHDDPTVLHMLQVLTGIDPKTVPITDPETISLFSSTKALGLKPEQIMGCQVGSLGLPEFGTKFVRQMLVDTVPTTIEELIRISGLSHGTDVWLNNAQDVIKEGKATLREVICTRDDIMNYLVSKGMDPTQAFYIMESVRKGKGLKEGWAEKMKAVGAPDWFVDSCLKIAYMFPKAHAVAYVMMALRIAYFKVHYPHAFYATYFTVRADNLNAAYLSSAETVRSKIAEIEAIGKAASALDQSQLTILEVALEMLERGIDFLPVDLYKSGASSCMIEEAGIRLPFTAMGGTGEAAAKGIVNARGKGEFISIEDLKSRSGISSAVITKLEENGCLIGLKKSNQISLFDIA